MRNGEPGGDEWTSAEREALRALPDSRNPDPALRDRTMQALRSTGLLGRTRASGGRRGLRIAIAASLTFAAGGFAGYQLALSRAATEAAPAGPQVVAQPAADAAPAPSDVHLVWF